MTKLTLTVLFRVIGLVLIGAAEGQATLPAVLLAALGFLFLLLEVEVHPPRVT